MVERREVGQLDDDRGRQHAGRGRVAELRGEQHQHRPEPLAARIDEVPRRLGDERVVALDRVAQQRLDRVDAGPDLGLEGGIGDDERRAGLRSRRRPPGPAT